ncbi:MAG: CocE/NonD family hydrolase [Bryobacteraceae bacterium]
MRLPQLRPALALVLSLAAWGQAPEPRIGVRVPMRDGVALSTNVFRPKGGERLSTILVRTPYGKGTSLAATYRLFYESGYAVVVQDVRGRGASEGMFRPLTQEVNDGHDTIDWIASQRWSDGKVGMVGGSYLGIVQWKAALSGSPHLKAISPAVSGCDDYMDRFYSRGGALRLGHRLNWLASTMRAPGYRSPDFSKYVLHLPLRTADLAATGRSIEMYQEAVQHPSYDAFWKSISTCEQLDKVQVPVLAFGGWYDPFVESDLEAISRLQAMGREAHVVIGPWAHNTSSRFPGFDFGPVADLPIRQLQLEWFDHWLKSREPERQLPPARVFLMGVNRWREEQEWPPERSRPVSWYLATGGRLRETPPDRDKPDRFDYDPRKPVPTLGGAVCCDPKIFPWGPMDQRPVEGRADVLVYTSSALGRNVPVLGIVNVELYVATTAPDTDFTAKLVDVWPDGRAVNLTDGILRLRYRESLERPRLARRGEIYRIVIDAGVTGHVFRAGHRIRLEISSSNFPRFDRNPNTGKPVAGETRLRTATQTVYHDRLRASRLMLPVAP